MLPFAHFLFFSLDYYTPVMLGLLGIMWVWSFNPPCHGLAVKVADFWVTVGTATWIDRATSLCRCVDEVFQPVPVKDERGLPRSLPLWRYSRPAWTRSCAACSGWPCFGRGVGLDDPQRSLPNPNAPWFCEVACRRREDCCTKAPEIHLHSRALAGLFLLGSLRCHCNIATPGELNLVASTVRWIVRTEMGWGKGTDT